MIVGVHQPNYLPYLGFFNKMQQSDIFVIYDDAQFNKEDFQHRNKIRIFNGWKWLTVPTEKKSIPINKIRINNEITRKGINWQDAHLKALKDNYKKAPYFHIYEKAIENIYYRKYDKLIDLNMSLIQFFKNAFHIKTELLFTSEFRFCSKSTKRLVEIVEAVGGDMYLSGSSGRNYLDISLFEDKGIEVKFQEFKHPIYQQRYKGFIPNMSAIDYLFNEGGKIKI